MTEYSFNVKVARVHPQELGAVAFLVPVDAGEIDVVPDSVIRVEITADGAELVKPGAVLTVTLSPAE